MDLNYNLYRLKYNYGRHLPLKKPVDVSLELASQCNMKCTYCYHAESNKDNLPFQKGVMTFPIAERILVQSASLGVPAIKTNWKGESSINPSFERITKLAKDLHGLYGCFIDRVTNSNFKFRHDREDVFRALANQTKVKVSYDSFRRDVFNTQRAGGDWDLTTKNIDKFYHKYMHDDVKLVIQAVRTNRNKDEDIEGEASKRWPGAEISIRDMVEGRLETDVSDQAVKQRDFKNRQPCKQAFVRLIFNWKGEAFPCCPDISESLKLGDISKNTVEEIFNGLYAKELRKDLKSKKAFQKNPCLTCSSYESFKGYKAGWDS